MTHVVMIVMSDLVHNSRVRCEAEALAAIGFQAVVFSDQIEVFQRLRVGLSSCLAHCAPVSAPPPDAL
jgi:hypothetical protein